MTEPTIDNQALAHSDLLFTSHKYLFAVHQLQFDDILGSLPLVHIPFIFDTSIRDSFTLNFFAFQKRGEERIDPLISTNFCVTRNLFP